MGSAVDPGYIFHSEILEQPAVISRLLHQGRESVETAADRIRDFAPEWVLIAARGTSDNAARYAQYLFGAHNRLGVGLAVPSLYTIYDAPPTASRALVIGISQSGQSPDVIAVIEESRRQGAVTLAITNDPASPLALAAECRVPVRAGEERAVAASKTYTSQLAALAMISAALEGEEARWDDLGQIPSAVETALSMCADLDQLVSRFWDARQFIVVGRGFNYCTAFETALKIEETSQIIAEPYSAADLLHGPVAVIDSGFPVILVAPSGRAATDVPALFDLLEARGAEVVAISDRKDVLERAHGALPCPAAVPEWLSPIVAAIPGQLFALGLARAKGLDPDHPRGLSKVTRTR